MSGETPERAVRRPKLLHVSIGGPILRSYFTGQLAYMRAHGFEVVVAARGGPDLDRLCGSEGVRARPIDLIRPLRPWRDLRALFALLRIVARERPDVVHCHTRAVGARSPQLPRTLLGNAPEATPGGAASPWADAPPHRPGRHDRVSTR